MDYNPELSFLYSQIMAAASYSQLAGTGAHHNDGGETPPVVSSFALPLQAHAQYQPAFQSTVVIGGAPLCCKMCCGTFVPLAVNGNYSDPNGDGKSYVGFNRTTSPWCGIPVASVLSGDLTGLIDRDNLARLNPNSGSIRLRMEVGDPSPARASHKLTHVNSGRATKDLSLRSA